MTNLIRVHENLYYNILSIQNIRLTYSPTMGGAEYPWYINIDPCGQFYFKAEEEARKAFNYILDQLEGKDEVRIYDGKWVTIEVLIA